MKTLDDALNTPGVVKGVKFQSVGLFETVVQPTRHARHVEVHGILSAEQMRRIADHLDPPATEEPRGCPLPGACACSTATLHIDRIKAEARREALEEAVKVCAAVQRDADAAFDGVVDRARTGGKNLELAGAAAAGMETSARKAAAAIRALIEKERT